MWWMPNNRQIAILFWLAVLLVSAATRAEFRPALRQAFKAVTHPEFAVMLIWFLVWEAAGLWAAMQVGLWDPNLAADSAFWMVGSGLVLFVDFTKVSKIRGFLRKKALGLLSLALVLQGLIDAIVFPLPIELIGQPILGLAVILLVVAKREEKYRLATSLLNGLLFLVGVAVLVHIVSTLTIGWSQLDHRNVVLQVLLPFWSTLWLLPLVYGFSVLSEYQSAFIRLDWKSNMSLWARLRARFVLLTGFHKNVHEVASFGGRWQQDLAAATSLREARSVVRDFRATQREKARAEAEAKERLVRFAGVDGVGDDGRRLDRREFKETKDALRWLASCMMGWYRNDNRYVSDLIERLDDDFSSNGLPKPSGISLLVSGDGQAWYAWRRTVTGWCFAIGADGPPPAEWEYDGPQPPEGFPGQEPLWGSQPFRSTANWSGD
jgi:hypothetical protein